LGIAEISKVAILGQQGSVWATSPGYSISTKEQKAVMDTFTIQNFEPLKLAGVKFSITHSKIQKEQDSGCMLTKMKQAVLVGQYFNPVHYGEARAVVKALVDHLISVGY
ncbi:profilin, partial [Mycena sp. CBHHK59/15]